VTGAFVYSSSEKPASWREDTCERSRVGCTEKSEVSACPVYPRAPISATFFRACVVTGGTGGLRERRVASAWFSSSAGAVQNSRR
jgi:hypothetical protein